ncbi:MAG: hypothetical protein HZB42_07390 [Sphingobacteriales bacterium]|nr:hypothetical protein [Sphingobacteriales bacterium]
MKISRSFDIIVNVLFPLLIGYFIYYAGENGFINPMIKNYLPDGLWAYSFTSALLIVWNREINIFWIIIAFVAALSIELLQYFGLMPGTADAFDFLMYAIFILTGLLTNKYYIKLFQSNHRV